MAVNRLWFTNTPSASIGELQRSQVAIGYPFVITEVVAVVITYLNYLRQYLNDSDTLNSLETSPTISLAPVSSYLTYLRSYLCDQ